MSSLLTTILVNNTASPVTLKEFGSIIVPASSTYNVTNIVKINELQESADLIAKINAGTLVINDGTSNLSLAQSLAYLQPLTKSQGEVNSLTSKNPAVDADLVLIEDSASSYAKKKITFAQFRALMSGGPATSTSAGSASTSGTTYLTKNSLAVTGVTGEIYRIGYACEFNSSANNKSVSVRCQNETDTVTLGEAVQQTNAATNWFNMSGFEYYTFASNTTVTFSMQYRAVDGAVTCSIRNSRLEKMRLS